VQYDDRLDQLQMLRPQRNNKVREIISDPTQDYVVLREDITLHGIKRDIRQNNLVIHAVAGAFDEILLGVASDLWLL
jgi:hypothetical protein